MHRFIYILIVLILFPALLDAQENRRYWIFFTDSNTDNYIEEIRAVTDSITVHSRWLDAVSVPATVQQLEMIQSFPFVKSVQPVARMKRPQPVPEPDFPGELQQRFGPLDDYYGFSETQITLHDIHLLHDAGIDGSGVTLGFLDTGYRWNLHAATRGANVLAERDFVAEHYPGEILPESHYNHGTLVFSVVAGYEPGMFIGVAPRAQFLLGATEDVRSETPIEEDFWVAGIEWMEEMGADIVSTSLGYSTFDHPFESYTPADMDGNTAVTTIAADRAFERGILVIASAGNSGDSPWHIITAPADGEHVVAAGAMHADGRITAFSSRGPSADGRIKHDVTALGSGVWRTQLTTHGYATSSGTSLSAPIVSGAATLVLSARPDLNAAELRNALLMSARRNDEPDNTFGYGILDAPAALAYPVVRLLPDGGRAIVSSIVGRNGIVPESVNLHLRTSSDPEYHVYPFRLIEPFRPAITSGLYRHILGEIYGGSSLNFVITAKDSSGRMLRYPATVSHEFYVSPVHNLISVVERVIPEVFVLHQNYPNPFNNRTVIRFELPEDERVAVTVHDILGRKIESLTDNFYLAGVHEISWQPAVQASGVYFYTIRFGGRLETGRMVFLR